jgi:hypothetical protein
MDAARFSRADLRESDSGQNGLSDENGVIESF